MKKRGLACLLAVLCVLLAGCGTAGETGESVQTAEEEESAAFVPRLDTEAEVTLSIIGYLENFESLEAVINDFVEYYPNCDVQYTAMENYKVMISTRLAGDSSVGLFMLNNSMYKGEVSNKSADLLKENIDISEIQPEALASCTADDGKLYGLPLAYNTSGLLVNTGLLEKEGLSVPENYEEFLSVCEALKAKGYTPIQGYWKDADYRFIRNMAFVQLGKTCDTMEKVEEFAAGGDGCAEFMLPDFKILCDLHENGYMDSAVNATYANSYDDAILKFFEGDVPFLVATTETFSGTKKRETKSEHYSKEPFEYEFICAPISDDGAYSYIESWQGLAVNDGCEDKEWAVEFLRFLATKDEINKLASIKGLPSVALESDDSRFDGIYSDNEDDMYFNDKFFPAAIANSLYKAAGEIGTGELDAEGAVAKMEELLRNGGEEEGEG